MIRNIVFDMGKVLVMFDPNRFMDREGIHDPEDRRMVLRELFQSIEWAQMDLGVLTEETAEPLVLKRFPDRLKENVRHLLSGWWEQRTCIPGMESLLHKLRESGYSLYLLSNASILHHQYWPEFPMSCLFAGKLVSCDYGIIKPDPRIYQLFTQKYALKPEECLFVDDLPANVAAAIQCGWSGIVFPGNAEDLIIKMQHAGIILKP